MKTCPKCGSIKVVTHPGSPNIKESHRCWSCEYRWAADELPSDESRMVLENELAKMAAGLNIPARIFVGPPSDDTLSAEFAKHEQAKLGARRKWYQEKVVEPMAREALGLPDEPIVTPPSTTEESQTPFRSPPP